MVLSPKRVVGLCGKACARTKRHNPWCSARSTCCAGAMRTAATLLSVWHQHDTALPHAVILLRMRHLYFHVPFCRRRCSYCDFSIAVRKRIPAREYVQAVRTELAALRTSSGWADPGAAPRGSWETIYFGGGTPSLLPPEAIRTLLLNAVPSTSSLHDVEVTLEANPEDVTPKSATAWRHAGVNRISLGAQSFDDRVLRWMHRPHDAARIGAALGTLRAAGFDNVSLDLIFALPAELGRDWRRDLDAAIRLAPAHLSLYGLTVEARTPLARWVSRGAASAPDDDRYAEEYLLAHERLGAAGFVFYEVSN